VTAEAPARPRRNPTLLGLLIALVASLAVVAFLVLVVVRPDNAAQQRPVDYAAVAADAARAVPFDPLAPALPPAWWANRAELTTAPAGGVSTWRIGFVTPHGDYVSLVQTADANPTWLADQVGNVPAGRTVSLGGLEWTSYDRRGTGDTGNVAFALVTEAGGSTIVLAGTAEDDEFAALATSVAAELAG